MSEREQEVLRSPWGQGSEAHASQGDTGSPQGRGAKPSASCACAQRGAQGPWTTAPAALCGYFSQQDEALLSRDGGEAHPVGGSVGSCVEPVERGSACCVATPETGAWPWTLGEDVPAPDTCAVIVAGGSGERFGDPRGKLFVPLCGLPVLAWSILALDRVPSVGQIVVACPRERMREVRDEVLGGLALRCPVTLVAGGATRQESVYAGLVATPDAYAYVAIHDGARPLVEAEVVERCIAALREDEALTGAILASRATDTLKIVDEAGIIRATPDRAPYWCAQTPQVFRRETILEAHRSAAWDGYEGTDDASLVEHQGGRVRVADSPRDNIKITVPEDLAVAEATLRARLERGI